VSSLLRGDIPHESDLAFPAFFQALSEVLILREITKISRLIRPAMTPSLTDSVPGPTTTVVGAGIGPIDFASADSLRLYERGYCFSALIRSLHKLFQVLLRC